MLSIVIGVGTGVASSLMAWWILYGYLSPKVEFPDVIHKRYSRIRGCGHNYQFTLGNARRRPAGDLEIAARLTLFEFPPGTPDKVSNSFVVPTDGDRLPFLAARSAQQPPRRLSLLLDDESFCRELLGFRSYIPQELVERLESRSASLEELLGLSPGSFLRISVMLTDGMSGTRRVQLSSTYSLGSIKEDLVYDLALRPLG